MIGVDIERLENPVDVVEHLAASNDWMFDRATEDEITINVGGGWTDYHVSITWMHDIEALHIACAFDLKVPEPRRAEVQRLLNMVNEQIWIGHFDLWSKEGLVLYRHALLLAGGAEPSDRQIEAMLHTATEACERYFQAFQFVVWAGRTAREAFDAVIFDTAGRA
ncbi:YbjN domain-containing protein [Terrihabitans sp. B22-R8]|uniref:YbjN domain-containing protein n=1 Tax=Terrihabitans sp. B22-R8 TaxID=3425128 RepID=UPI00403D04CF